MPDDVKSQGPFSNTDKKGGATINNAAERPGSVPESGDYSVIKASGAAQCRSAEFAMMIVFAHKFDDPKHKVRGLKEQQTSTRFSHEEKAAGRSEWR